MSLKFILDLLTNDSVLKAVDDATMAMSAEDPERARAEHDRREEAKARARLIAKKYPGESATDRSPIHLTRGSIEGDAFEGAEGIWQLVVTLPEPRPGFVVMPRHAHPDAPREVTGEPVFDRRFTVFADPRALAQLGHRVRKRWLSSDCDWLYGRGTMTASAGRFKSRFTLLGMLEAGMDLAEALVAAGTETPERLLAALSDPAWKVGAAALDALLEHHTSSRELGHAYDFLHTNRDATYERLRVHGLRRAQDWRGVLGIALGAQRAARSDAFEVLLAEGPLELAAQAASTLMLTRDGLDDARLAKVVRAFVEGDPRLVAATSVEQRERFLIAVFEVEREVAEIDVLPVVRAATELLAATGSTFAYAELSRYASRSRRAAALVGRIKARLGSGGGLALADGDAGALTLHDPE